jgi:hypothetical protein
MSHSPTCLHGLLKGQLYLSAHHIRRRFWKIKIRTDYCGTEDKSKRDNLENKKTKMMLIFNFKGCAM